MHTCVEKLNHVKNKINEIVDRKQLKTAPQIIAVTKSFSFNKITPLIRFICNEQTQGADVEELMIQAFKQRHSRL